MGDQDCLALAENAGARILTINGQTIMVNGATLKVDAMGSTDLFSVLQSAEVPMEQDPPAPPLGREHMDLQEDAEGGFLLYFDNESSELQSMQITPDQAVALGLDDPAVQTPVMEEPPPLAIPQSILEKAPKPPVTFSIRLQTNAPKIRPPPLHIVSGPLLPPPGKVAIPRPTEEARIIRTNPNSMVRSTKVIPRILATPTTAPPLVPFSKSVLKVNKIPEVAKVTAAPLKQMTDMNKPLGSSENPIQLVQHGQTYHSIQHLNQEQLKQISTVLQQKQIETTRNTKNVLFDESTNTKIIYRVVCPETLEIKKIVDKPPPRKRGRPSKAKKLSDDEEYLELDISKGEKEERKKLIPRTRSGRLSRPPRHMVKDYKRIHHLDFAEPDLDDSDGGYSDYQISDSEVGPPETSSTENNPSNGAQKTPKQINSRFRCPTCLKIYLGYKRLAQHFTQFPEHGSIDALPPQLPPAVKENGKIKHLKKKKVNRKQPASAETSNKIKNFLANCDASEVAGIAGSAVANSMDLWDLLLLKISVEKGEGTRTETMLRELDTLLDKAKETLASIVLTPPSESASTEFAEISIANTAAAVALNAPCGIIKILKSEDEKLIWIPPAPEAVEEHATLSPEVEAMPEPDTTASPQTESLSIPQSDALLLPDPESEALSISNPLTLPHSDPITIPQSNVIPPSPVKLDTFDLSGNALESGAACALNATLESEKPSDNSLLSDNPLDEIVSAELNNLVSKSGLSDFVSPPEPNAVGAHIFSDQTSVFHSAVDMELDTVKPDLMDHNGFESLSNHSLDQTGLVGAPHEVDFEALSEEFNRNTQA